MPEPIIELIALNVEETLKGVTVSNGYHYDLSVERITRKQPETGHLKAFVYQLDPEQGEELLNRDNLIQPFAIDVIVLPSETDTTPVDTYTNRVWADMVKALKVDVTRGGYCIDTKTHPPISFSAVNGELDGFTLNLECYFRIAWDNPYQLRT